MHDDAARVIWSQSSGMALDTDELEAMGGMAWLEQFAHLARRRDLVDLERTSRGLIPNIHKIRQRDVTSLVETLSVDQGDVGAGGTHVRKSHPAIDVLPEVGHLPIGTDFGDRYGANEFDPTDWRRRGPTEPSDAPSGNDDRTPFVGFSDVVLDLTCDRVGSDQLPRTSHPI
jgi:hypothetical protein